MKPTRVLDLLALGAFAAVIAFVLVSVFYADFPPITTLAGGSLYPVAALEVAMAFFIRSRVLGKREIGQAREQLHPITVARAVALAKASALVGAASTGIWLGFLGFVVAKQAELKAAMSDRTGVVVGLVGAIALTAAALWLEHCCKMPEEPPEEPAAQS